MTPESEKLAAKKRELKVQANDQLRVILGSDKLSEFEAWEKNKKMQSLKSVFDAAR
jgi:nicotinic acid mononucleotide adenylyltransferase